MESTVKIAKILVPTDFSEESNKALHYAIALARPNGSEILLVHVVELPIYPVNLGISPVVVPPLDREIRDRMQDALARLVAEQVPKDLVARAALRDGRPSQEIVAAARAEDADLIVIATHGHTGLKKVLLGSTTERVVREAPCPVLVVRQRERDFIDK